MRDYWLTQSLLQAVGWGYVLAVVIALLLAGWAPRRKKVKVLAVLAVLVVASISPIKGYRQYREQQQIAQERKERYQKAKELFDDRCKGAGERIYKVVEGVEEILLLNLRDQNQIENEANRFWPDAGLPNEGGGSGYINNFLMWESSGQNPRGALYNKRKGPNDHPGYRYVDVKGLDGKLWRYTLKKQGEGGASEAGYPGLMKFEYQGPLARYAVSYQNIVNAEDRQHWVAGSMVSVIDLKTNEILAQATWYSFEPGLGSKAGGRQPWRFARSCPELTGGQERAPVRFFVDKVLRPKERSET
ncbi:hypothetical protein [Paracidovorax oryzae]|uniref:hypothetical protein n=1 Tax=Paracidovorax oryzae TaxID=862720 RepID=UPI0012FEE760|nr:hypothetical protein [Paracidovorax oryzae]